MESETQGVEHKPQLPRLADLPGEINPLVKMKTTTFLEERRNQLASGDGIQHDNKLTHLPLNQDGARKFAMQEFAKRQASPEKGSSMLVYSDLDQLKRVNDLDSKEAGNHYIKWGAADLINRLNAAITSPGRAGFGQDPQIVSMRAGHAADETIVWLFGLSPEEEARVKAELAQFSVGVDVLLDTATGPEPFHASSSVGFVSTSDEWFKENIEPGIHYTEAVQMMEQHCDNMAKEEKIAKELEKLPIKQLFEPRNLDEFIKMMTVKFGGGRISQHLLEILLQMQSIKAVASVAPEQYQIMLERLGVTKEILSATIALAHTPREKIEAMIKVFRGLFGENGEENKVQE